ncbi:MAG: ABC transporter ATP-binding protein [Gammaproteobacteria bacterium]|nr:ABC transporter ATP-binding protein [Gammaproteobacteria bacterium]
MPQTSTDPFLDEPWKRGDGQPFLRIDGVTKRFGDFVAVGDVSLDIYEREFFSLLGGSGCGKTTLLRMLAGLELPSAGRIFIDGQDMSRVPPYERPVNMMFQSYALFPHMNVRNNVAFGPQAGSHSQSRDRRARGRDSVSGGNGPVLPRRQPSELSAAGHAVALARALVKRPKLLLLDEPLAALDKKLRERTQLELSRIQERVGITFVLVTHDQEEAMNLSTRIAVMREGRFEQIGTPREIYETPANRFVAGFIGSVNLLECAPGDTAGQLRALNLDITVQPSDRRTAAAEHTWVAIRPEKMRLQREAPPADDGGAPVNAVAGQIEEITYLGSHSIYHVRTAGDITLTVTVPMPDFGGRRGYLVG